MAWAADERLKVDGFIPTPVSLYCAGVAAMIAEAHAAEAVAADQERILERFRYWQDKHPGEVELYEGVLTAIK